MARHPRKPALDEAERQKAKAYWATPGTQPLDYKVPSHYARALAEVVEALGAASVFEFGCAAGRNLAAIQDMSAQPLKLAGCDINVESITRGNADARLDLKVADEEYLPSLKARSFDVVFTVSVLDHLPDPEFTMGELLRIARQAVVFVEPVNAEALGKVNPINTRWSQREAVTPFTYFHDYYAMYRRKRASLCLDIPMPTHLNKVGPFYRMMILRPAGTKGKAPDWNRLSDTIIASALLQSVENRTTGEAEFKQKLRSATSERERALAQLQTRTGELNKAASHLQKTIVKLDKAQLKTAKLEAELARVRASTKYKIGKAVVGVVRLPYTLATNPTRLFAKSKPQALPHPKRGNAPAAARSDSASNQQEISIYRSLVVARQAQASAGKASSVCYVLHNSLPYASGGYATRARGVVRGLTANGLQVSVLTRAGFPLDVKKDLKPSTLPLRDVIDGITYERIAEPYRTLVSLEDHVRQSADEMERRFKAQGLGHILAASFAQYSGLPALIAARRLGLPFYYEVRGLAEVTMESRDDGFKDSHGYKFLVDLEHLVCSEADHVFTLTQPMKDELVARGLAAEKVTLVPNSCDIERFTPRPRDEALAAELGIPSGLPVIGYIGTFVDYEGLDDLAEAAGLLRQRGQDFRLLLVGGENVTDSSQGPLTRRIREIIAAEGLEKQVIMPGRVPHDMVERYYSLIDIAPFPRKPWRVCEMVSPMKPLEAMAMEKTVLVSSVQALKDMVRHGETGWVFDKGSVESLADELGTLLADPELRRKLGRQSRTWVAEERTWKRSTQAMVQLFSAEPR